MNTEETIWIKDFNILFEKEKLFKYIPLNSYSNYEKMNSMMRFTLYISVLLSFLYKNLNYFKMKNSDFKFYLEWIDLMTEFTFELKSSILIDYQKGGNSFNLSISVFSESGLSTLLSFLK